MSLPIDTIAWGCSYRPWDAASTRVSVWCEKTVCDEHALALERARKASNEATGIILSYSKARRDASVQSASRFPLSCVSRQHWELSRSTLASNWWYLPSYPCVSSLPSTSRAKDSTLHTIYRDAQKHGANDCALHFWQLIARCRLCPDQQLPDIFQQLQVLVLPLHPPTVPFVHSSPHAPPKSRPGTVLQLIPPAFPLHTALTCARPRPSAACPAPP